MERSNAWEKYSKTDLEKVFTFAEDYRKFISLCKTEYMLLIWARLLFCSISARSLSRMA